MQQKNTKEAEHNIRLLQMINGGCIAIILIILQALLAIRPLDALLIIAMVIFALALPLPTGCLVVVYTQNISSRYKDSDKLYALTALGALCTLTGIGVALWDASWIAALAYVVSICVASFLLLPLILEADEPEL